jgi:hypothetical protein
MGTLTTNGTLPYCIAFAATSMSAPAYPIDFSGQSVDARRRP